jgi:hypothetical protein
VMANLIDKLTIEFDAKDFYKDLHKEIESIKSEAFAKGFNAGLSWCPSESAASFKRKSLDNYLHESRFKFDKGVR